MTQASGMVSSPHLDEFDRAARLAGEPTLRERFDVLTQEWAHRPQTPTWEETQRRNRFVGELRTLLARSTIEALEPDLVILDEFQRFKHLLDRRQRRS